MGRWHDEIVGPHLVSMYQVAFEVDQFDRLVQWLAVNRDGLNVLVHPHTENAYNDHLVFGFWLGDKLPLNEERLIRMADRESRIRWRFSIHGLAVPGWGFYNISYDFSSGSS